jgi:hypothetical protein
MIAALRKLIADGRYTNEALTAQLLIGRIELNRAETDAPGSFSKAKKALEPLATKYPKTWQGQLARIGLLQILHLSRQDRETISAAQKALKEIDWGLFGKDAPADLAEFKTMSDIGPDLSPDFVTALIVRSYVKVNEPKEAERWLSQIEDKDMRRELQQMLKDN